MAQVTFFVIFDIMKRFFLIVLSFILGCQLSSAQVATCEWNPGDPMDQDAYAFSSFKCDRNILNAKKLTLSGAGVAAAGAILMIDGNHRKNEASWKNIRGVSSVAQSPIDRAVMEHSIGMVATGIGAALGGIGGYLWIHSSSQKKKLGPAPSGLGLALNF